MTQAAKGAVILRDCLREAGGDMRAVTDSFQNRLAEFSDLAFSMAAEGDALYEGADLRGVPRPEPDSIEYFAQLEQLATEDPDVLLHFTGALYGMELRDLESDQLKAKAQAWVNLGRTVKESNRDPQRIPDVTATAGIHDATEEITGVWTQ
jgi:hypothetical protein